MKIQPVGAELFHADRWVDGQTDRQTDMMKLIDTIHSFSNMPKNGLQPPSDDGIQLNVCVPEKLTSRKHSIL